MQQRDAARSFEVVGPVTRLVQAGVIDVLELRRPVLGQQVELSLMRHSSRVTSPDATA